MYIQKATSCKKEKGKSKITEENRKNKENTNYKGEN